jgi:hypothetical protein
MRIAVFLVLGLIVVLLAVGLTVWAVTCWLALGFARRPWFRPIGIGSAGSVGLEVPSRHRLNENAL